MFFNDPNLFASAIELAYKDKGIKIVPENLHEVDTRQVIVATKQKGKKQRPSSSTTIRDLIRLYTVGNGAVIFNILLGLEEQSYIDYRMPLRVAHYDLHRLLEQVGRRMREIDRMLDAHEIELEGGERLGRFLKTDRIIPVITAVIYLGCEPWDGPRTLREMYTDVPDEFFDITPDYDMHLIDPHDFTPEEIASLPEDLSLLFEVTGSTESKKDASIVFAKDERYHNANFNTAALISAILGIPLPENNGKEVDLPNHYTKAIQEIENKAHETGRAEGRAEGREELRQQLLATCGNNLPPEAIELLNAPVRT